MEKVSIVVPVYNAENCVKACIDSLLQQDYKNLEIILIDDGSRDKSPAICDAYADNDTRVQVFHRKNSGVSVTRNFGINHATGEFIMFVDSDDTIEKNTVSDNLKLAKESKADVVIYGNKYYIVDQNRIQENPLESFAGTNQEFFECYYAKLLGEEALNPPWNKLIRRELLMEENIFFHESFSICEDMAFTAQLLKVCKTIVLNDKLYYNYYIKPEGSLVFKFHANFFEALTFFYKEATQYCNRFAEKENQQRQVDMIFLSKTIMFIKRICCDSGWDRKMQISRIKEICEQDCIRNVLENVTLKRKKRLICVLIRCRCYRLVWLLYHMKKCLQ